MGAFDAQCLEDGRQAFGLGADVVAADGAVAVAEAGQVEGDDPIAVREVAGKTQPVILVGSETVDQYQGFALDRPSEVVMNVKIAGT